MKFIEKLEYWVNRFVFWLIQITKNILKKYLSANTIQNIQNKCQNTKEKIKNTKIRVIEFGKKSWDKTKKLKESGVQNTIAPARDKIEFIISKSKEMGPSQINQLIKDYCHHYYKKIKNYLDTLEPKTLTMGMIVACISCLAIINIYVSSKKIISGKSRYLSSEVEQKKMFRPDYYRQEDKYYAIGNFRMPIYTGETQHTLRSLQIEFVVQTSTRYARNFLQNRDILGRDYVNRKFEPFIPEFTLTEEGKQVIKSKVKDELNNLLKENHIGGEVTEVFINDLMTN